MNNEIKFEIYVEGAKRSEGVWPSDRPWILGRSSQCDHPIASDQVSRQHLKLEREGERYFISDLGSANGTTLNGQKIVPHLRIEFSPLAEIKLGRDVQLKMVQKGELTMTFSQTSSQKDATIMRPRSIDARDRHHKAQKQGKPRREGTLSMTLSRLLRLKNFSPSGREDTMDRYQKEQWIKEKEKLRDQQRSLQLKLVLALLVSLGLFFAYRFFIQKRSLMGTHELRPTPYASVLLTKPCLDYVEEKVCQRMGPPLAPYEGARLQREGQLKHLFIVKDSSAIIDPRLHSRSTLKQREEARGELLKIIALPPLQALMAEQGIDQVTLITSLWYRERRYAFEALSLGEGQLKELRSQAAPAEDLGPWQRLQSD